MEPAASRPGHASEISELILDEHARILRLFGALDDLVRCGDPAAARLAPARIWARITGLLDVHTRAEEAICFPLVFGTGAEARALAEAEIAGHDGIREAMEESRLLETGSSGWWQAIATVRAACAEHFAREEQGPLARTCRGLPPETSKILVRKWAAFAARSTGTAPV